MRREDLEDGITEIREEFIAEASQPRKSLFAPMIFALASIVIMAIFLWPKHQQTVVIPSQEPDSSAGETIEKTPLPFDDTKTILSISLEMRSIDGGGSSLFEGDGFDTLLSFESLPVFLYRDMYGEEANMDELKEAAYAAMETLGDTIEKENEFFNHFTIKEETYGVGCTPGYLQINVLDNLDFEAARDDVVYAKAMEFLTQYRSLFPYENPVVVVKNHVAVVCEAERDERQLFINMLASSVIEVGSQGLVRSVNIHRTASIPYEVVDEYPLISYEEALANLKARKSYPQTLEEPEVAHIALSYFTDYNNGFVYPVYVFSLPQKNPYFHWNYEDYYVIAIDNRYIDIDYPTAVIVEKAEVDPTSSLCQQAEQGVRRFYGEDIRIEETYCLKEEDSIVLFIFNLIEHGEKTCAFVDPTFNPTIVSGGSKARSQYDYYKYGELFILRYR